MKQGVILLVTLLAMGCGKGKEEPARESDTTTSAKVDEITPPGEQLQPTGNIIMPLAAGNQWVFQILAIDTTVDSLRPFKIDTFSVVSDTFVGNTSWFQFDGLGPDRGFAVNWQDGLWFVRPPQEPFLLAKYPAAVGDEYVSRIGDVETVTRVMALDAEVTVPAGRFFCYHYRQSVGLEPKITNYYFAPGVGLVKMEIMDRSGRFPVGKSELVKMTLMRMGKPVTGS